MEFACSKHAEQYVLKNIALMADRPQVILHGDFHRNDCVLDEEENAGIIDFSGNNAGRMRKAFVTKKLLYLQALI